MKKPKTEKQLLVSAIRKAWMCSPGRREVLRRCKHPTKSKWWICELCKKETQRLPVDHIDAVGKAPDELEGFGKYIHAMFTRPLQGLCDECHDAKTKEDRKAQRKKVA